MESYGYFFKNIFEVEGWIFVSYDTLRWEVKEGVGILTLNRPEKLNTFSVQVFHEIRDVLQNAHSDESVRVLLLRGEGGTFSAGGDMEMLKYLNTFKEGALLQQAVADLVKLAGDMYHFEKPVLASVQGYCLGVGLSLASLCDIRIASEKAVLGTEFIAMGLVPDTGILYTLPRIVGKAKAKEMFLTCRRIKAEEAEKMGLVNALFSEQELEEESFKMARQIAQFPPIAIKMAKQGLDRFSGDGKEIEDVLSYESFAQALCLNTGDHREAVSAFLEKRKPEFKGR